MRINIDMKKLVVILILLCAAGAAAWFIYREVPALSLIHI